MLQICANRNAANLQIKMLQIRANRNAANLQIKMLQICMQICKYLHTANMHTANMHAGCCKSVCCKSACCKSACYNSAKVHTHRKAVPAFSPRVHTYSLQGEVPHTSQDVRVVITSDMLPGADDLEEV